MMSMNWVSSDQPPGDCEALGFDEEAVGARVVRGERGEDGEREERGADVS
jgi:hypothetical protein